jgi:hypothetical protein
MRLLEWIKNLFKFNTQNWNEKYLADAVDHYDLERRQRELDRGQVRPGFYGHTKPSRY